MGNCISDAGASPVAPPEIEQTKDEYNIHVGREEGLRVRESVRDVMKNSRKVDRLMKAWHMMKKRKHDDPLSFFNIGGYHGAPFLYRPDIDKIQPYDDYQKYIYWGGYCQHGNVLFPTWHRAYVLAIENALLSYDEDTAQVTMPYWDETSRQTLEEGIPTIFTDEEYTFTDGCTKDFKKGDRIKNPLKSFKFPIGVTDKLQTYDSEGNVQNEDSIYAKPAGYETVRFPLSGLVGTPEARKKTEEHNSKYKDVKIQNTALNLNVQSFMLLNPPTPISVVGRAFDGGNKEIDIWSTVNKFEACLEAPNYTAFSNTTSASAWVKTMDDGDSQLVTALESPHNDVHLAVGGIDLRPEQEIVAGILAGANGDMGENNTAGLDPIFFFHHCFIDMVFWLWQRKHHERIETKDKLDIIEGFPGTNSVDVQGPTPFHQPGESLDLDTPLYPFSKEVRGEKRSWYTSKELINIEKVGYTYAKSSLEPLVSDTGKFVKSLSKNPSKSGALNVSGISRINYNGSFMIKLFKNDKLVGFESVLSRGNVTNCANCMKHLEVSARFPVSTDDQDLRVELVHRGTKDGKPREEEGDVVQAQIKKKELKLGGSDVKALAAGAPTKEGPKLSLVVRGN